MLCGNSFWSVLKRLKAIIKFPCAFVDYEATVINIPRKGVEKDAKKTPRKQEGGMDRVSIPFSSSPRMKKDSQE